MKRSRPAETEAVIQFRRGDVLWVDCEPSFGVEPSKTRTCVVVSNDIANEFGQAVTLVPTQAWTLERSRRGYGVDLRTPRSSLPDARVANASMVVTFDRRRVVKRAGRVAPEALAELDRALALHLGLREP